MKYKLIEIKWLPLYRGPITCPDCHSTNTGQSTYVDWCNDCGWSFGY